MQSYTVCNFESMIAFKTVYSECLKVILIILNTVQWIVDIILRAI